jgi:hypothetical protein
MVSEVRRDMYREEVAYTDPNLEKLPKLYVQKDSYGYNIN